jgi:hypothetical protein
MRHGNARIMSRVSFSSFETGVFGFPGHKHGRNIVLNFLRTDMIEENFKFSLIYRHLKFTAQEHP